MEHAASPQYRKLSPIGFWVAWSCALFDGILAYWLYIHPLTMIPSPGGWKYFWSLVFGTLAVYLMVTLLTNNMKGVRFSMILNVIAKSFWAWTLVLLAQRTGFLASLSILDLWFFVAIVQAIIAIFTPPRIDYGLLAK